MDEVISGIQVIKMYAWEKPFSKLISMARKLELRVVRQNAYLRGIYMTFLLFTTRMALFCTMLTMTLSEKEITAARIFVVSAYFNILAHVMSQMFVRGVAEIAEVLVAMERLRAFLVYEEKGEEKGFGLILGNQNSGSRTEINDDLMILAKNATARWSSPDELRKKKKDLKVLQLELEETIPFRPPTLDNLNFHCQKGSLIGVIGAVGAGKSSLLQAILRELPLESGELLVNGTVSYACQEPWVFAASIRQNILFGLEYEKGHYMSVVRACNLQPDFEHLPFGDQSIIGERGSSLSGGQKARVSLARTMYRTADIYLLDDPLSAVDAHVARHLFDECIGPKNKLCKRQTRVLVTHQVHFLKDADWLIVLRDGTIDMQGKPGDLFKESKDMEQYLSLLDDDEQGDPNESVADSLKSSGKSSRKTSESSQMKMEDKKAGEKDIAEQMNLEMTSKGQVQGSLFLRYLKSGGSNALIFIIFSLFLMTQLLASVFDWFVSYWTRQEALRTLYNSGNATTTRDLTIDPPILSTEVCLYIQGTLVLCLFLVGIFRALSFYSACIRASQNLHGDMFTSLVSAKMRFFDTNPSGRILNRFSKDIGAVDEWLPKVILDSTQMVLSLLGAVVVAVVVDYLFLIPITVLAIAFMFVRKIYLKSSKNIKRLDGISE